jgi:mannose-6-phosphate isomerase-like protein (cupin superfamily)
MEFLEIIWNLTESEYHSIKVNSLPYVLKYSEAKTYKEAIKSPKTVNRTLVHEDLIPRFCMGSVETDGPDAVGAHKHPMLEQHFFGLPGNYCYVKADDAEVTFHERALLHIPLGSEHSVRVDAGHKLHYIWIDYFRDAAGVEWIKKMHKSDK